MSSNKLQYLGEDLQSTVDHISDIGLSALKSGPDSPQVTALSLCLACHLRMQCEVSARRRGGLRKITSSSIDSKRLSLHIKNFVQTTPPKETNVPHFYCLPWSPSFPGMLASWPQITGVEKWYQHWALSLWPISWDFMGFGHSWWYLVFFENNATPNSPNGKHMFG